MSSTVPITTDTLPSNVPKLNVKGTNWAIFSLRFQIAVEAKELWKCFDGTTSRPMGASSTAQDGTVTVVGDSTEAVSQIMRGIKEMARA
ncbi:hypothetical protein DEU56DRAFT_914820 [Suillus clintonianus]|uniref:uncharacterized protein n=1 Tax=Suillus clintonianus TaxID=1904413 RepID=UPI001B86BA11|nr:uncharacterized protein DEU56DRAFT_914820 [Suillus clintonianus]KAG2130391.1 hypothetical protein DEU56DRAFT_914820 [Suillus clintonianus]